MLERKEQLKQAVRAKDLSFINSFQTNSWTSLDEEEKEMLGWLFAYKGEEQLLEKNSRGISGLHRAIKLAPKSTALMCYIGHVLTNQKDDHRSLKRAKEIFENALKLSPNSNDAWHGLAKAVLYLGRNRTSSEDLIKADRIFTNKESYFADSASAFCYYWEWGNCLYYLGKQSGEPQDFLNALSKYEKSERFGNREIAFFFDVGNANQELYKLLLQDAYLLRAIESYRESVIVDSKFFQGWESLALALQSLYQNNESADSSEYFEAACKAFSKACSIDDSQASLWFKWGTLLAKEGEKNDDIKFLRQSLERFEKAAKIEPNHPDILRCLGEVLIAIGLNTDDGSYLFRAEEMIKKSLEIAPRRGASWRLYGICYYELGQHYEDKEYFLHAIRLFNKALSYDKEDPLIWYEIALIHRDYGDFTDDIQYTERSLQFFSQAIEIGTIKHPQFWDDWGSAWMSRYLSTKNKSDLVQAIENYEKALAHAHENLIEVHWIDHYGYALDLLGDISEEAEYTEKAVLVLSQAVQITPELFLPRFHLACALVRLGDFLGEIQQYQQAIDHFEKLIKDQPEEEDVWCEYGLALLQLALLIDDPVLPARSLCLIQEAEKKMLHAASLGNESVYYHLACLYATQGDFVTTMQYLERANTSNTLPEVEEILHDEFLERIQQNPIFQNFITKISDNQ